MKKVLTLLTFCFYYSVASYAQDNGLSRKSEKKGTPANGVEAKSETKESETKTGKTASRKKIVVAGSETAKKDSTKTTTTPANSMMRKATKGSE